MSFKDHFSSGAAGYAAFRPVYPPALVYAIADAAPAGDVIWDCACGNGQLSAPLTARFGKVWATDASAEQIAAAAPHPDIVYSVAKAEASGLPDRSVDAISVAQAAHWFDLPAFYAEARRVARPGAVLALISYGGMEIPDRPDIRALVGRFFKALDPYWPPERALVDQGYRNLLFPFPEVPAPSLAMEAQWGVDQLFGYVDTWSAVRALEKAEGRARLEAFRDELAAAWGDGPDQLLMIWPLTLKLGRID